MRKVPLVLAVVAAVLLAPAAADAALVRGGSDGPCDTHSGCHPSPFVIVVASAGERNDVLVVRQGAQIVIRDTGTRPVAQGTCTAVDPQTVVCPTGGVDVSLGDGDDRAETLPGTEARVLLGPGDDRSVGGDAHGEAGDDVIVGSDGRNQLSGGPGADVVLAGDGDDVIGSGESAEPRPSRPDVFDGQAGRDTVDYGSEAAGVKVDLAAGTAEAADGTRDLLASIENARGTPHADRLLGDDGPNWLEGDAGRDVVVGRGGDDHVRSAWTADGGIGNDVVSGAGLVIGGDGHDELRPVPGASAACGPGLDTVVTYQTSKPYRLGLDGCERLLAEIQTNRVLLDLPAPGADRLPLKVRRTASDSPEDVLLAVAAAARRPGTPRRPRTEGVGFTLTARGQGRLLVPVARGGRPMGGRVVVDLEIRALARSQAAEDVVLDTRLVLGPL